jgi:hypothetical protein
VESQVFVIHRCFPLLTLVRTQRCAWPARVPTATVMQANIDLLD